MAAEIKIRVPSALCSLGHRPLLFTGFLLQELRAHFADPMSIEHDEFRERLWAPGNELGIMIEDHTVWKPTQSGARPAIIIRRNGFTPQKRLINNQHGLKEEGFTSHVKFHTGTHTLFVIAKEGAEAELLATEVYRYLLHFSPVIRSIFSLHMFELMDVGALAEVKEATDRLGVPITVGYGWEDHWVLQSHAPKLKRIQLSTLFPQF